MGSFENHCIYILYIFLLILNRFKILNFPKSYIVKGLDEEVQIIREDGSLYFQNKIYHAPLGIKKQSGKIMNFFKISNMIIENRI